MIIEYAIHDISLSDEEFVTNIQSAIGFNPDCISILPPYLKIIKPLINNHNNKIKIATSIDFPLGILDTKTRNSAVESACKSGANIVNVVAQPYYFCNRKYDKFKEDIKSNLEISNKYNVSIRYVLEYRVFTYDLLYRVSKVLLELGIDTIYPSTGYLLDDINDNILASVLINKKVPINIISNGNVWNIDQINNIVKIKPFGIQVNSINALSMLYKNKINS